VSCKSNAIGRLCAGCGALFLVGCAVAPPTPLGEGETCFSLTLALNRLDQEGVQKIAARQNFGESLTAEEKAKADGYNQLLQKYLAARCQIAKTSPAGL
jgi:hypothetical protein